MSAAGLAPRPARVRALILAAGLGTVSSVGLLSEPGLAAGPPLVTRAAPAAGDPGALALLRRASRAAYGTSYRGVQYVSSWGDGAATSVVVEVAHRAGAGSLVRVESTAAGGGVSVYESDSRAGAAEVDAPGGALALLERNFVVRMGWPDQVAGHRADVVEVRRPAGSLAARLWLDHRTGLVLRREVHDTHGRLVRASAFVQLDVGEPGAVPQPVADRGQALPPPWGARLTAAQLAGMRTAGWAVPQSLPPDLSRYDARARTAGGRQVLHLSYSDGLSTVSMFEQRGRLADADLHDWRKTRLAGATVYVRDTLPQRLSWASRGMVYTLIADAPPETVEAVVRSLPHGRRSVGFVTRVHRGLVRIGSWFNPFG